MKNGFLQQRYIYLWRTQCFCGDFFKVVMGFYTFLCNFVPQRDNSPYNGAFRHTYHGKEIIGLNRQHQPSRHRHGHPRRALCPHLPSDGRGVVLHRPHRRLHCRKHPHRGGARLQPHDPLLYARNQRRRHHKFRASLPDDVKIPDFNC